MSIHIFQVTMALHRLLGSFQLALLPYVNTATPPHDLGKIELSDTNGKKITVRVATPDLTVISFAANSSEAKRGADYQGTPIIINPNSGTFTNSGAVQSVKPLIGQIILYKNYNYTGDSLVLTESTPDLGVYGWNDAASSARVICGKWELYQGTNYQGNHSTTSGDPEALSPIPGIPNDSLSSVKFIPEV